MSNIWDKVVGAVCAAAGAVMGIFGEWNTLLTVLLICNAIDYISGLVCAAMGRSDKTESHGLSSKVGFFGLAKKGFIWVVILLATVLDFVLHEQLGTQAMMFQTAACCFYVSMEGISILENAALMDVPLPGFLTRALEVIRKRAEDQAEGMLGGEQQRQDPE